MISQSLIHTHRQMSTRSNKHGRGHETVSTVHASGRLLILIGQVSVGGRDLVVAGFIPTRGGASVVMLAVVGIVNGIVVVRIQILSATNRGTDTRMTNSVPRERMTRK